MIDVKDVSKSYGAIQALNNVSFHVDAGEIIGLLGPNGAGKTTTMKILTGYLMPDDGDVTVDGLDVLANTLEVRRRIGYLPESAPLYPEMTVQGYLRWIADLRGISVEEQRDHIAQAVRATGLEDHLTRPIGQLSKGYRQRVGIAQAILHKPSLLVLDEPTIGLDPTQIVEVRRLIRRLAKKSTVLLSTHILSEVEAVCGRVIILLNGRVRADSRLEDLATTVNVVLVLDAGTPGVVAELKALDDVRSVETVVTPDGDAYRICGANGADLRPEIYKLARDREWPLRELRRDVRTLETVFNELATVEMSDAEELDADSETDGGDEE
jgi:ABC-2 type transport system ATP-binding protein